MTKYLLFSKLTLLLGFIYYPCHAQVSFKEVKIGEQIWMVQNLNVTTFRNGEPIPFAKTAEEWKKFAENQIPAYCYVPGDFEGKKYGALYNWYAATDERFLAPEGWHIPSIYEFEDLIRYCGAIEEADKHLTIPLRGHSNCDGMEEAGKHLKENSLPNTGEFHAIKTPYCTEEMVFQNYETNSSPLFCAFWSEEDVQELVYRGETLETMDKLPLPVTKASALVTYTDYQLNSANNKANIISLNQSCGVSIRCIKNIW